MAKPTTTPVWNTDGTNRTPPSAGQQATGWTVNQAAVSSYFNWLFYWIYEWILWLAAGGHESKTLLVSAAGGAPGSDTQTFAHSGNYVDINTVSGGWFVTIPVDTGKRITAVRAHVKDNATGTTTVNASVRRAGITGGSTVVASMTSSGAGTDQTLSSGALTEDTAINTHYYVWFSLSAANTCRVYGVEVDYKVL